MEVLKEVLKYLGKSYMQMMIAITALIMIYAVIVSGQLFWFLSYTFVATTAFEFLLFAIKLIIVGFKRLKEKNKIN